MKNLQENKTFTLLTRAVLFALFLVVALIFLTSATSAAVPTNQSADGVWADIAEDAIRVQGQRMIVPEQYRTVVTDLAALSANLAQAPMEFTQAAENNQVTITLPLPDGSYDEYYLYESPVMHPELAAKFPEIKTYTVRGVNNVHASGRVDLTPHGFHAMVHSPGATFFVDPYSQRDTGHYISYYKADFERAEDDLMIELPPEGEAPPLVLEGGVTTGPTLRTHRLAVATTGEYSQFHGGTKPLVMAEIVTAINRVTGIYEREIAVRLELIPNNDLIIFLDAATDPYTNNNGGAMLGQNQTTLTNIIGAANYDVGHVFSTGGGGIASLGVVCNDGSKARGVTGLPNPTGDPFYVDYVAHELGHQYAGNHTFNGNEGACAGGNRNPSTAYEPGSGSTIQAYAGICGSQNLQSNSDDYFHTISFQEMAGFSHNGNGSTCGTTTATGNDTPVVDAGTGGFTIPINTPFILTGSATDNDPLTYMWEQFNLGPAGHPNSPTANAPIFRSFDALLTPTRVFPMMTDIVNNTQTIGEILPSYSRDLTFRFTARDNDTSPGAGGVAYDSIDFDVTDTAGPFLVQTPNGFVEGLDWPVGATRQVTWDVANTDVAPVSCANVDIDLSIDGGFTAPISLAASTPNDGSAWVLVPNNITATARVWVSCSDNIFFDMSNSNFSIVNQAPFSELALTKRVSPEGDVNPGTTLSYTLSLTNTGTAVATATITDTFSTALLNTECNAVPGDLSDTFTLNPGTANAVSYDCSGDVDPSLAMEINKSVDQTEINSGQAVTYTITVTNPNAISVENITVSDPDVSGCTPSLGTPITLNAGASQTYVCPDIVLTEDTTNTAVVSGEITIDNVATASAPGAVNSPVSSNVTANTVTMTAQDSVTVTVESTNLYMPAVFKADASNAVPAAALPMLGLSAVLLGGAMMVFINRKK